MVANALRPLLILLSLLLLGGAAFYLWQEVPGQKSRVQTVVPLPAARLYPYLSEVQKLDMWLPFAERKDFAGVNFYSPYAGTGAAVEYFGKEKSPQLEIYLRRAAENRSVQYSLFRPKATRPTQITAILKETSVGQTAITWRITTPPARRIDQLMAGDKTADLEERLAGSGAALNSLITGSIQEENYLKNIQFDSIFTENIQPTMYVGTNASSAAKPENFTASVQLNGNKVRNFAAIDIQLKPMEFGKVSVFLPSYSGRGLQVSYFAGVPVRKKVASGDQNFIIVQKPGGAVWSKFYKGTMAGVPEVVSELSRAVTKAGRKPREYQLIFIQNPQKDKPLMMKISALAE